MNDDWRSQRRTVIEEHLNLCHQFKTMFGRNVLISFTYMLNVLYICVFSSL